MMFSFASSPIKAKIQRIACKCTNINKPGPRDKIEPITAKALIELETTAPA